MYIKRPDCWILITHNDRMNLNGNEDFHPELIERIELSFAREE
jgi:hypothetical protein